MCYVVKLTFLLRFVYMVDVVFNIRNELGTTEIFVGINTPYGQQRFKKKIWLQNVLWAILRHFSSITFSSQN